MHRFLAFFFGILLLTSSFFHVYHPDFYAPMIPDIFPEYLVNVLTAMVELIIAVPLFVAVYRREGGFLFMVLMLLFLPIHVWDFLKEEPMVGSKLGGIIRLVIQFVLIYGGWWIWKKGGKAKLKLDGAK